MDQTKSNSGCTELAAGIFLPDEKMLALSWKQPYAELNGCAVAIGKLVDCRPMMEKDEDKCFVEYHFGLYCHIYENVHPITPFPWKGTQGWKEVSFKIKEGIQVLPACR